MLYIPQNSKFKKFHKGKKLFRLQNCCNILFLNKTLILKSIEPGRLNSRQIITIKQTINKIIKKRGKNFIKVFPNVGISKKPREIRMGKGKGAVDHWIFKVKAGTLLCEMFLTSLSIKPGIKALKLIQKKLPFHTKILKKIKL
jgi:large subunit ribosomal protein L16